MSPWNHSALVSLRGDLKLRVLMEAGLGDKLENAAGGFMTEFEAQTVREQPGNIKQIDKVIEILLGKADEDFTTFLKVLRDTNNGVWAEELVKTAEQFKREGVCVERGDTSQKYTALSQCCTLHTSCVTASYNSTIRLIEKTYNDNSIYCLVIFGELPHYLLRLTTY